MNKKLLFALLLLATVPRLFAQTKMEKFCQVTTHYKAGFSAKRLSVVSYGEQPNLFAFKDSATIISLQKVNALTTDADVMNYMASIGWQFVTIIGVANGWENLYFKKEFDKSELADQ